MPRRPGSISSWQPRPHVLAGRHPRVGLGAGPPPEVIEPVEPDPDLAEPIPLVLPDWGAAQRPARTSRVLVAALAVMVALALAAWTVLANRDHSDGRPTPQSRAEPSQSQALQTPAHVSPDSSYTRLTVTGAGDLQVEQWIRSTAAVSGLTVATPHGPLLAPGAVRATELQVTADGAVVPGPDEVIDDSATYSFTGARLIRLSYLLSGVLEHSSTARGRALARVTSLDLSYQPEPRRSVITFRGARLLSLACDTDADDDPPVPCGVRGEDGWTVDVPDPQDYQVMAQIDLPSTTS